MPDGLPGTLADCVRALPPAGRVTTSWTAAQLGQRVDEQAAVLRGQGVADGEAVGLPLANSDQWILAFLALLAAGARPLLIAPETPAPERGGLLARTGCGRWVVAGPATGDLHLAGQAGQGRGPAGVLLPTSGSTGEPKVVLRTEGSLVAEAVRYRDLLGLDGHGRLLLPLPLSHAYALGWLAAALLAGTQVRAVPPTALNTIAEDLRDRATMVALVPTLARLLADRQLRRGTAAPAPALYLAMVGAGPVDAALEASFRRAFGVGTARNYGSTETGAVFAGLPGLPPLCVGEPMPGVQYAIVDDDAQPCAPGSPGALRVRLGGDGRWRDTMDVAVREPAGLVILGRRHNAIRRAGQWVAPLEVEAALREHAEVRDAHVWSRHGRFQDEAVLIADVEVADPARLRGAELVVFARDRLAPHKVPQEIRVHAQLLRTSAGKVVRRRRYRLAASDTLLAAARAYRQSELLFALLDLGVLPLLEGVLDVGELAARLGLPSRELDWLLTVAAGLGLVEAAAAEPDAAEPHAAEPAQADGQRAAAASNGQVARNVPDATPFLELEAILSRTWVSRAALADAVRLGIEQRPFERADLDDRLSAAYPAAMHDAAARQRTQLGLRLSRHLPHQRVVEVTAGPGRYLEQLLTSDPAVSGCVVQLGRLAGPLTPAVAAAAGHGRVEVRGDPPAGEFDLCVVANGIHGPAPGGDLPWLLDLAGPAGALLIDDVFLPAGGGPGSELGLDWLTHGGIAWPHVEDLIGSLVAAGRGKTVHKRLGSSQCHLVLATEG